MMKRRQLARRDDSPQDALQKMLDAGASLGGAGTGAIVGGVIAGPPGALAGAGTGWATEKLIAAAGEFALRRLSPRAEMRAGAVVILAAQEISARIMAGEEPREDLRDEITPGRSPADELAEAVLRAAAEMHEERKLRYLAHLHAQCSFERGISPTHMNQLIGVAEQLTYRQLVVLAVYAEPDDDNWRLLNLVGEASAHSGGDDESPERRSLRVDLLDLFRRDLIRVRQREHRVRKEKPYRPPTQRRGPGAHTLRIPEYEHANEALPWPAIPLEINPSQTHLSGEGERLARMMRLQEIPADDRERLVLEHLVARRRTAS